MTTLSSYLLVANNMDKWKSITSSAPEVKTATGYFQKSIGKVHSAEELLKDRRLFNYAMTAFGLGDKTYAVGLMRKVLEQGVSSSKALANTLHDPNILAFARAFNFAGNGAETTASSGLVSNVVGRYVENSLETKQGEANPGVKLALYFQRNAPNVTSIYGVLADKNLLTVVQTALGISPNTSAQPIDTQAKLLKAQVKIEDFKDPKKLAQFIARFAAMYDAGAASSDGAASAGSTLSLFGASDSSQTIGLDMTTLLKTQNISFSRL